MVSSKEIAVQSIDLLFCLGNLQNTPSSILGLHLLGRCEAPLRPASVEGVCSRATGVSWNRRARRAVGPHERGVGNGSPQEAGKPMSSVLSGGLSPLLFLGPVPHPPDFLCLLDLFGLLFEHCSRMAPQRTTWHFLTYSTNFSKQELDWLPRSGILHWSSQLWPLGVNIFKQGCENTSSKDSVGLLGMPSFSSELNLKYVST